MKYFVLYTLGGGEIHISGSCQDEDFAAQEKPGLGLLEGQGTNATHYVSNGRLVEYSDEQKAAKASRPQWAAQWSNEEMRWLDPRSLDQLKASKWAQLKEQRAAEEYAPLPYLDATFDADAESQQKILGVFSFIQIAPADWSIDWTTRENTVTTLTKAQMTGLGAALLQRTNTIYTNYRAKREAVEAATTAEEVAAVS